MKKNIIFLNNHFQQSDGTVRALIGLVNHLDQEKFDITIRSIYRCDKSLAAQMNPNIKLEKTFGFYVKGLSTLVRHLPVRWLYNWTIGGRYDIEVAFQCDVPTYIVGNSLNPKAVHVVWMHGYGLQPQEFINCDQVVCVSKYCADKANLEMNHKIHAEYLYNLVDDVLVRKAGKEPVSRKYPDRLQFVSVGRISPEKGYPRLVRILSQLRKEGFIFHMTIVGDGPEMPVLKKTVEECVMGESITLTGADPNPHKYTAKADLFICSSYKEGYSTACTEAAILEVPIITTNVPGGQEIIDDCKCGIVTGLDDESLKNGIRKVLECPDLLKQWKAIMQKSCKNFYLETRLKNITEMFESFSKLSDQRKADL